MLYIYMYTYREREGEPWKQPNMFAIEDFPSGISFFLWWGATYLEAQGSRTKNREVDTSGHHI